MGVDYRGTVCVGYTYEQVEKLKQQANFDGDFYEFVESEDFESFAPYFDADKEYCIYGYHVLVSGDYCKQKVDLH